MLKDVGFVGKGEHYLPSQGVGVHLLVWRFGGDVWWDVLGYGVWKEKEEGGRRGRNRGKRGRRRRGEEWNKKTGMEKIRKKEKKMTRGTR